MSIEFIDDCDILDLGERLWQGGLETYEDIRRADKEDELEQFINEVFYDQTPTLMQINDLLWHDSEAVYEACGLDEDGEEKVTLDGQDGEVSEKYCTVFEKDHEDYINTYLDYSLDEVGKLELVGKDGKQREYTSITFDFSSPVDTTTINREHYEQYIKELTELTETEENGNGELYEKLQVVIDITNNYDELIASGHIPSMSIACTVLGRALEDELNDISNFMDKVYDIGDKYQEFEGELE